ncbi:hypothetical protein lerEdw1_017215 [Lerista edwardsae]|nr:hypothetical protein lerEdw1_017215 [Lerista edwardsae]
MDQAKKPQEAVFIPECNEDGSFTQERIDAETVIRCRIADSGPHMPLPDHLTLTLTLMDHPNIQLCAGLAFAAVRIPG